MKGVVDELGIVVDEDGTLDCKVDKLVEEKGDRGSEVVDPIDLSRSRDVVVCCERGTVGSTAEFEGETRGGRRGRFILIFDLS